MSGIDIRTNDQGLAFLQKYDKNGSKDLELSEVKALVAEFDTNGDGKISGEAEEKTLTAATGDKNLAQVIKAVSGEAVNGEIGNRFEVRFTKENWFSNDTQTLNAEVERNPDGSATYNLFDTPSSGRPAVIPSDLTSLTITTQDGLTLAGEPTPIKYNDDRKNDFAEGMLYTFAGTLDQIIVPKGMKVTVNEGKLEVTADQQMAIDQINAESKAKIASENAPPKPVEAKPVTGWEGPPESSRNGTEVYFVIDNQKYEIVGSAGDPTPRHADSGNQVDGDTAKTILASLKKALADGKVPAAFVEDIAYQVGRMKP
jgi:hypothetical protein